MMESDNGIPCWAGRVVEADIDLRGEPGGFDCARGVVDSDPEAIAAFLRSKAPETVRIGIETGPTTTWLWTELNRLGLPVICIDARHAKAVLKMQINKSDRNDAAGIARIMQTGWFKEVRVKDLDSHAVRALLASRALLVKIKRDLENQIRGLLKNLGLVIGRAKFNVFAVRAEGLIENRPELVAAVRPLLEARKAIEQQVEDLDRRRRPGCCRDRADVAHHAGRCDALVDPLDGGGDWLFPHHHPPDVGSVRLAAAP
jgi:transposase